MHVSGPVHQFSYPIENFNSYVAPFSNIFDLLVGKYVYDIFAQYSYELSIDDDVQVRFGAKVGLDVVGTEFSRRHIVAVQVDRPENLVEVDALKDAGADVFSELVAGEADRLKRGIVLQ